MPFEFGDVFLVRFPFTDQTSAKQRPAVVVSKRSYNDARPDVVAMAITTNLEPGELAITDWRTAGLLRPSVVKPSRLWFGAGGGRSPPAILPHSRN
jgi:mRNA interferase MazF